MTRPNPVEGKARTRKPCAIMLELRREFEPECATANECIAERHRECPILRFRALLAELRRSLRDTRGAKR